MKSHETTIGASVARFALQTFVHGALRKPELVIPEAKSGRHARHLARFVPRRDPRSLRSIHDITTPQASQ